MQVAARPVWELACDNVWRDVPIHSSSACSILRIVSFVAFVAVVCGSAAAADADWSEVDRWSEPGGEVLTVAVGPDGVSIVTGSADGNVRLRNVVTGKSRAMRGHTDAVNDVAYDPKGLYVVSASKDRTIRVWDVKTRRMRLQIGGTRSAATAVAIDGERGIVVGGGSDNTVRFFDVNSGGRLREYSVRGRVGSVSDILIDATGNLAFVSGGPFPSTSILTHSVNIENGVYMAELYRTANDESINGSIARSADGGTFAVGGEAGVLTVWGMGATARRSTGHTAAIYGVSVIPTGELIATGGADDTVRIWDTATGDQVALLEGHSKSVNDVAFGPNGDWLVSVSADRTTRLWRPSRPEPEPEPEPPPVIVRKPPPMPSLRLDRADVSLRDGDGDGALTADEAGTIEAVVLNVGTGPAVGYQIAISPDTIPELVYEHQAPIGDVPAGGSVTVTLPIRATPRVVSRTQSIDVYVRAPDGSVVASVPFVLRTKEREEPDLVVVDYTISDVNGVHVGAATTVTVTIRNRGSALAEDVIVTVLADGSAVGLAEVTPLPAADQLGRGRGGILVGDLAPTDFVNVSFSISLPTGFTGGSLPIRIVGQEATGVFGVDQSVALAVWAPPAAALIVAEGVLSDADPDGVLVTDEPASLRVKIRNDGSATASRVRVIVRPSTLPGLSYMASVFAGDLASGESSVLTIPIGADEDVGTLDRTLSLVAIDAAGNESAPLDVRFRTRPAAEPQLRVVSVLIDGEYDGAITAGKTHRIEVSVANDGTGDAEGVRVTLTASVDGASTQVPPAAGSPTVIRPGVQGRYAFDYVTPTTVEADTVAIHVGVMERRPLYGVVDFLTAPVSRPTVQTSNTHALVVGVNKYANHANLVNPVGDTRAIATELEEAYGATVELLTDATRRDFLSSLYALADREYADDDELFVMFSGHGYYDERLKRGYLAFSDSAALDSDPFYDTYVSHEDVRTVLERLDCKHVLLIVDSCFSGTLDPLIAMASGGRPVEDAYGLVPRAEYVRRKLQYKTRRYITAGGREYVPDGRPGHHSPFVRQLLEALRSYGGSDGILTLEEMLLYLDRVTPEPRTGELLGNEPGSSFIFVAQLAESAPAAPAPVSGVVLVSVSPPDAEVTIEGAPESLTDLLRTLVVAPIAKNRRYRLPVGVYQLRVSRAGYVTDVRELRVEPGTRDVSVTLRPQ